MPLRQFSILLGCMLLTATPPAFAHGMAGVVQPLVIAAIVVGAIGGAIVGGVGAHPGVGLLSSIGALSAVVAVFVILEADGPGFELLGALLMMLTLIAFAGAIPLTIAFFVTYAAATSLRERARHESERRDNAL